MAFSQVRVAEARLVDRCTRGLAEMGAVGAPAPASASTPALADGLMGADALGHLFARFPQ